MSKLPTRSPTHEDLDLSRLSSMGLELEDIARDDQVSLGDLVELAEDRGRPASHYLAAIPLASELAISGEAPLAVRVCAGTCQRYGALDLLDHLVGRWQAGDGATFRVVPVACLDRCDHAPAIELDGAHGKLVLAPATRAALDEALGAV